MAVLERGLARRGERVRWVNWGLATDETLKRVVLGVGPRMLRHIFCRFLQGGREVRRGLPDVLIFDGPTTHLQGSFPAVIREGCFFVEIKGPGDTLSGAQQAWIDYLLQGGAQVEVWNVRQSGGEQAWVSSLLGENCGDAASRAV